MADRPIVFSGSMIRVLLAGRKTQTRRVLKPQPEVDGFWRDKPRPEPCGWTQDQWDRIYTGRYPDGFRCAQSPPYDAGDRLWVREAWRVGLAYDDLSPAALSGEEIVDYVADSNTARWSIGRPRSPIYMPRWASRLTLTVTDVRVQRLQEITPADAIAEGIPAAANSQTIDCDTPNPRDGFRNLWNSIHGPDAWDANPWVRAISFETRRENIDASAD